MKIIFSFIVCLLIFINAPAFALTGSDISPGTACSVEDSIMATANPGGSGGYFLTCESGTWKATISGETPTVNEHLTTKEYVDTAVPQTLTEVLTEGNSAGNAKITSLATPTANADAATKAYVDAAAGGSAVYYSTQACIDGFGNVGQNSDFAGGIGLVNVCVEGAASSGTAFETGTDGTFVLSDSTFNGSLGGLSGADAKCLTELQTYDWKNKENVTLSSAKVKAFICSDTTCNNLNANTEYYFARVGYPQYGGDSFTTDSSGRGVGDLATWSTSQRFNTASSYWSNRSVINEAVWSTNRNQAGSTNSCTGFTSSSSSRNAYTGDTNDVNSKRWKSTNLDFHCGQLLSIICIVHP